MATVITVTIINNLKMIFNSLAITEIMTDSMVIQATGHKMISNQLHHTTLRTTNTYLRNLIHHSLNRNNPIINTFHQRRIGPTAMEMATSIHNLDIDIDGERLKMTHTKPSGYVQFFPIRYHKYKFYHFPFDFFIFFSSLSLAIIASKYILATNKQILN